MKVCAVSPWADASKSDILAFLGEEAAELVVLPGVFKNTPSQHEVQRNIRPGVAVFVEYGGSKGKAIPYLVTCDSIEPMPCGIFSQSPKARQMDDLVRAWPDRTFAIGPRKVTFAICGEINGFNLDGHAKGGRELPFDILANPVHTVMGRWHILGPKLSALSKARVVIHVANNNRNHDGLKTDVRIYIDKTLQDAKVQRRKKLKWCECDIPPNQQGTAAL